MDIIWSVSDFLVSTIREFCNAFEGNYFVINIVVYLLFLKSPTGEATIKYVNVCKICF